ncbi:hypothetical protein L1887_05990 [Cichorium endivia]|nr:hypothetical protein L1887_05990 [Cichorium endivia]
MDTCIALFTALLAVTVITVKCQINTTPCTLSMITGFTPCVNYITGSSANGRSPSASCCDAVESLMTTSMDCSCLLLTGNVPFSLPSPINQALAISLPQACNSQSMALQCKGDNFNESLNVLFNLKLVLGLTFLFCIAASGVSLPPPGPMLFAPPPPKAFAPIADSPEFPPIPSEMIAVTPTRSDSSAEVSTNAPEATAPVTRANPRVVSGIRPVVTATSASDPLSISLTLVLLVILVNYWF